MPRVMAPPFQPPVGMPPLPRQPALQPGRLPATLPMQTAFPQTVLPQAAAPQTGLPQLALQPTVALAPQPMTTALPQQTALSAQPMAFPQAGLQLQQPLNFAAMAPLTSAGTQPQSDAEATGDRASRYRKVFHA